MWLRMTVGCAAVCACFAFPALAQEHNTCDAPGETHTKFGDWFNESRELSANEVARIPASVPGYKVRYLRARVESTGLAPWTLLVRDRLFRVIDIRTSTGSEAHAIQWTARLPAGEDLLFDLHGPVPAPSTQTKVVLSRLITMPEQAKMAYYSVADPASPAFRSIGSAKSDALKRKASSVGMLVSGWGRDNWCCSAALVANDLVLTNWHCGGLPEKMAADSFWSDEVCANTIFDFSWDGDNFDREAHCVERLKQIKGEQDLDYVLLRIRSVDGRALPPPLELRTTRVSDNETISLVHHPACRVKQATESCRVASAHYGATEAQKEKTFAHSCDSENGSSGGAVFDSSHRVVGLHRAGYERVEGKCDKLNKAVPIGSIVGGLPDAVKSKMTQIR